MSDETIWNDVAQQVGAYAAVTIMAFPNMDSIEAMAEHVIEKAPPEFSLAGHSMGGRVSLEVVRRAPDRVRRLGCSIRVFIRVAIQSSKAAAVSSRPRARKGYDSARR